MEIRISLPIKKVYLESIIRGEKKFEYRADKPFFRKLFAKPATRLWLHCYSKNGVLVEILSISLVENPYPKGKRPDFLNTPMVFAISLGRIIENKYNNI